MFDTLPPLTSLQGILFLKARTPPPFIWLWVEKRHGYCLGSPPVNSELLTGGPTIIACCDLCHADGFIFHIQSFCLVPPFPTVVNVNPFPDDSVMDLDSTVKSLFDAFRASRRRLMLLNENMRSRFKPGSSVKHEISFQTNLSLWKCSWLMLNMKQPDGLAE